MALGAVAFTQFMHYQYNYLNINVLVNDAFTYWMIISVFCAMTTGITRNFNDIKFTFSYLKAFFRLRAMLTKTPFAYFYRVKRCRWITFTATVVMITLYSGSGLSYNYYLSTLDKSPSTLSLLRALIITSGSIELAMSLTVVTVLGVTTGKVYRLLSSHKHLRVNEKSIMVKVVFSLMTWLANAFFFFIMW